MDVTIGSNPAAYVRRSTEKQSDRHQQRDIKRWLEYQELQVGDVEWFVETASGASGERPEFQSLIDKVERRDVTDVIVWEISRIARNGLLAQGFFDACEDSQVTIYVTNGSVRKVEPDGHGRLVADIVAAVAAEERRRLIERTKSGVQKAISEGKWVGQVPAGFITVDGYLRPNFSPDYDAGEVGFYDMVEAIEAIDSGDSYRSTAMSTPNVTRQTLSAIDQDEQRRKWYLEGEAEDERVQAAVKEADV